MAFWRDWQDDPAVSKVESCADAARDHHSDQRQGLRVEASGNHWVVQGDRGVTYSDALPDNAKVMAGTWWPEGYTGPAQVSFAAEEAEEMGLKLGDKITVNILGRDIEATITSFREVDFSTAGMGFVMSMNAGALAGAPHSYISTVYATEAAEAPILRDLARAYPNITAIRVRDAIDRVTEALDGDCHSDRLGGGGKPADGVCGADRGGGSGGAGADARGGGAEGAGGHAGADFGQFRAAVGVAGGSGGGGGDCRGRAGRLGRDAVCDGGGLCV